MAKTFTDALSLLRNGQADMDAGVRLTELVAAVRESNKSGKITITLNVKPLGDGSQVQVDDSIKVTLPSPKVSATVLFTDPTTNTLSRRDSRQPELQNLRDVEEPAKQVSATKGPH